MIAHLNVRDRGDSTAFSLGISQEGMICTTWFVAFFAVALLGLVVGASLESLGASLSVIWPCLVVLAAGICFAANRLHRRNIRLTVELLEKLGGHARASEPAFRSPTAEAVAEEPSVQSLRQI